MSEPAEDEAEQSTPQRVDDAEFRREHTLEELRKGKRPLRSLDEMSISWLTDEEWEAFCRAINA